MPLKTLYFDYDRTLFDTDLFNRTVWQLLGERTDIDAASEEEQARRYFIYNNDLYHYDFFAHLRALGLDTDELVSWLVGQLRTKQLLFPEAAQALHDARKRFNVEILTYGDDRYQKLKMQSSAELDECRYNIVLQPKLVFFETWQEPSILVDDKLLADQLPDHVRFIHIDRTQQEPVMHHKHPDYISINSLIEIEGIV